MAKEMFLEYMQHVLNEGSCFKAKTFRFIVLKKSIPIDSLLDNLKNYVEPKSEDSKIDDNELKVFQDFISSMKKDGYTRVKAYEENEIFPLM